MLVQQTIDGMFRLKLHAMARALDRQRETPGVMDLSFEDRLALLVDAELNARDARKHARLLKTARLKVQASAEDIDFRAQRGLEKRVVASLLLCDWIEKGRNLLLTGPTGVGKTWLACAFAMEAIRHGLPAMYRRMPLLLEDLEIARADGSLRRMRNQLGRMRLLIIDDWGIVPLKAQGRQDLLELIDDRIGTGSLIITSQLPVSEWHSYLAEPTIADAILDRLVHESQRINLKGDSMRRVKATKPD